MPAIPFSGARNVTVWKLPYTLPLNTSLGLLWQVYSTQSTPGVLEDAFASLQDGLDSYTQTLFRLTPSARVDYPLIGTSGVQPMGAAAVADGVNMEILATVPQYARYSLGPPGAVNVVAFTPVTAPDHPPFFGIYQLIRFFPVVKAGALAYRLFSQDSGFFPWYTILEPGNVFTNWQPGNVLENQPAVLDFAGNRTLMYYQPTGQVLAISISGAGVESSAVLFANPAGTGHTWLDNPSFANSMLLNGWLLSADNSVIGSGPLVPSGSPVFLVAPDLSSYAELVFQPGNGAVLPNGLGVYGPAWNYGAAFFSTPLVVCDTLGNLYYIQLNPGGTAYDVYSTAAPLTVCSRELSPDSVPPAELFSAATSKLTIERKVFFNEHSKHRRRQHDRKPRTTTQADRRTAPARSRSKTGRFAPRRAFSAPAADDQQRRYNSRGQAPYRKSRSRAGNRCRFKSATE